MIKECKKSQQDNCFDSPDSDKQRDGNTTERTKDRKRTMSAL